jgi:hypothetical protein
MRAQLIGIILSIVLSGCSVDLQRNDANKLIEQSPRVNELKNIVYVRPGYYDEGVSQGLWSTKDNILIFSDRTVKEILSLDNGRITPSRPVTVSIKVTGMRDISKDPAVKLAEFEWSYATLSPLVRRFALSGGRGSATFTKYDDGWRIESLDTSVSEDTVKLSAAEIAEIESDKTAKMAELEKLRNDIRASFMLKSGGFSNRILDNSGHWGYEITDNDVRFLDTVDGKLQPVSIVWFRNMSITSFDNIGINIQSLVRCRYASIFKRAPDTIVNTDLIEQIKKKQEEWYQKYGDQDELMAEQTYCSEHVRGGFGKE